MEWSRPIRSAARGCTGKDTATDASVFLWFNRLATRTPWAHGVIAAWAVYGIGALALLMLGAWWTARRAPDGPARGAATVGAGLAAVIALVVNQPLGHLVGRARPFAAMRGVQVLIHHGRDVSLPSDHAVAAGAVAAVLVLVDRRIHDPGDVLAGLLLGALIGVAGYPVARLALPLARALARTPLRPLVAAPRRG